MGPVDFEEIRRVKVRVHRLQRATALSSHALTISLSNSPIALHLQVPSVPLPLPSSRCPPPRAPSLSLSPSSHSLPLLTHPPSLPTYLPTSPSLSLSFSPSPSLPYPTCSLPSHTLTLFVPSSSYSRIPLPISLPQHFSFSRFFCFVVAALPLCFYLPRPAALGGCSRRRRSPCRCCRVCVCPPRRDALRERASRLKTGDAA